jgi:hypothetical protein
MKYPDEGVLPSSGGGTLDKDGVKDTGYLDKKGTPNSNSLLSLPPGTNIDDQKIKDIREMRMLNYKGGYSYPGDSGF